MADNKKEFKTLEEQVSILEKRGMVIPDKDYARDILLRENYFFLNGYRHPFISIGTDRYIKGTTFSEVYSLFLFDRRVRNLIFKNLLIIENNIKSIISYQLSRKYGYREEEYLKPRNFDHNPEKKRQISDLLHKMKRQVKINANQHSATLHYMNHYGYIPLWVLVKVLSFGIVSEFYSILKLEDRLQIASIYNIDQEELMNYLPLLANYRNLCAHEDIVYENKTQRVLKETKYHRLLNIPKEGDEYVKGVNDLFAIVIIMKIMLTPKEFNDIIDTFDKLITDLNNNLKVITIDKILDRIGFPKNWKDLKNL